VDNLHLFKEEFSTAEIGLLYCVEWGGCKNFSGYEVRIFKIITYMKVLSQGKC